MRIVGDNVNVQSSPRYMSKKNQVHTYDLFNMMAVANRVPFEDKLDVRRVTYEAATKSLTEFVPDKEENNLLREDFKHLVGNVLKKYIPSLQ